VLLLAVIAARADEARKPKPEGYQEFHAAWQAFAAPAKEKRQEPISLDERQQARLAALPHMQAAVDANDRDPAYRAALAYIQFEAAKYQQAKESIDKAIDRERRDPLLYLLRGRTEAALAQLGPDTAAERIDPALRAFDDAARLDPANSLPLLQAASVALHVGRRDLALSKVEKALERPRFVLYPLPLPEAFDADPGQSIRMWQYVQLTHWQQLLARCINVQRVLLKAGEEKEKAEDPAAAERYYRQALEVGRRTGAAEPNLIMAVNYGIGMMDQAYAWLARLAEATGSSELARWTGESGVLYLGQQDLLGANQRYWQRLAEDPPASIAELLRFEASLVRGVILGIGLTPVASKKDTAAGKPAESPA
jgi:tetratricopeptide (TPR) repeat protein